MKVSVPRGGERLPCGKHDSLPHGNRNQVDVDVDGLILGIRGVRRNWCGEE